MDQDSAVRIVQSTRRMLQDRADNQRAAASKAYLKSPFNVLGVSKPEVSAIGRQLRRDIKVQGRGVLLHTVGELWESSVHEEKSLAVVLASLCADQLEAEDVTGLFSGWLDACRTWDHVDELCIRVVGVLALRHPSLWAEIESWATSPHMWKRRASLISQLPAVRAGRASGERLERTCAILAPDRDFFIRKAIGWVLRELSEVDRPQMVCIFRSIGKDISLLSRREATRKLPLAERDVLQAAVCGSTLPLHG